MHENSNNSLRQDVHEYCKAGPTTLSTFLNDLHLHYKHFFKTNFAAIFFIFLNYVIMKLFFFKK